jgi:hypothetical protein
MTLVSACTPNTRQRPSLVMTVAKPRVVISGSTACGRDRYTRTPSSDQTCTTKS